MRRRVLVVAALGASAVVHAGEPPPGFSRLANIAPGVTQEMRYAGPNNFTGAAVPGYRAPQCWLRTEAAKALASAQAEARAKNFSLVVYDCYRPKRAVAAFVDWSKSADEKTKAEYFPHIEKRRLFAQGYIAAQSTHSTGLAVDLGVFGWDFGTPFDYFDKRSWTQSASPTEAHSHRETLVALMRKHGFENYPREWWHFTYKSAGPAPSYDVEIE